MSQNAPGARTSRAPRASRRAPAAGRPGYARVPAVDLPRTIATPADSWPAWTDRAIYQPTRPFPEDAR